MTDELHDRLSGAAFALLVIFIIGWYWMPSTRNQASSFHNGLFYLGVMPALWALFVIRPRKPNPIKPLTAASIALIAYLAASALWVQGSAERPLGAVILHALATATFVTGVIRIFDRSRLDLFRRVVITAATSIALVSIIAWLFGRAYHVGRLHSAIHFEHPNLFAQYLGFAALLALGSALRARTRNSRIVWTAASAILGLGIFLTRGRGVILSVVSVGLISIALNRSRKTAVTTLAAVLVVVGLSQAVGPMVVAFVARGDAGRIQVWQSLLARISDNPLIGAGINAADDTVFPQGSEDFPRGFTVPHPHSAVIGTLYYGGLLGLGLLFLVIVLGWRAGRRNAGVDDEWDPLILLLFGVMCLIPDGHRLISEPHLSSWLLLWLPIGLIAAGPFGRRDTVATEDL